MPSFATGQVQNSAVFLQVQKRKQIGDKEFCLLHISVLVQNVVILGIEPIGKPIFF
jgi:hypothetical protein